MSLVEQKNIAIVCNPLAGVGKAVNLAERVSFDLRSRQIPCVLFQKDWPADFMGFTDVFIVGGDGTLNYFINRYPGIKIPLVIFNGGTGNDFHRMLYGQKNFTQLIETALGGQLQPIDLGKCNERYFINGIGIGFEGEVTRVLTGRKKILGKTSFLVSILKKIFTYRAIEYNLQTAEELITGKKLMISICNGRWVGGGFQIAPEAKANDSLLDIIIIDPLHSLQMLRWLPVIEKGKHLKKSFVKYFQCTEIRIDSRDIMQAHLDGEYYESKKFNIELLPGQLIFRC